MINKARKFLLYDLKLIRIRNSYYKTINFDDYTFNFICEAAKTNKNRYNELIEEIMEVLDLKNYCDGNIAMARSMADGYIAKGVADGNIDIFFNKIGGN